MRWERQQGLALVASVAALVALGVALTIGIDAAAGGDGARRALELAPELVLFSGAMGAAQWAWRLERDGEWLAMRAAGGHPMRLVMPLGLAAAVVAGAWLMFTSVRRAATEPILGASAPAARASVTREPDGALIVSWSSAATGRRQLEIPAGASVTRAPAPPAATRPARSGLPARGPGWAGVVAAALVLGAASQLRSSSRRRGGAFPAVNRAGSRPDGRPHARPGRREVGAWGAGMVIGFAALALELAAHVAGGAPAVLPCTLTAAAALSAAHLGRAPR